MEIAERNRYVLGKILEECAFSERWDNKTIKQLGSFYLSAMDTKKIDELKFEPIKEWARKIDEIKEKNELISLISEFHRYGLEAMFSYSSDSDEKNSSIYAYYLEQGGLSLPNRDYYLLDSFESIRGYYKRHVANLFSLYGQSLQDAERSAETVFEIELQLAKSSRTPVELRDPERNYNRLMYEDLDRSIPSVGMRRYLSEIGLPDVKHIVIRQPEFFENLGKMLDSISLSEWKTYLTWKLLHFASPFLHEEVMKEYFALNFENFSIAVFFVSSVIQSNFLSFSLNASFRSDTISSILRLDSSVNSLSTYSFPSASPICPSIN